MATTLTPRQAHELIASAPHAVLEARAAQARRRWSDLWWLVPLAPLLAAVVVVIVVPHVGDDAARLTADAVARSVLVVVLPLAAAAGVAARLLAEASRAADAARLPGWYDEDGGLTARAEALVEEADRLLRRYAVGPPPLEPAEALATAARSMLQAR